MKKIIRINEADNVVVALEDIKAGDQIEVGGKVIKVKQDVATGHKIAITNIDGIVIKYGFEIGVVKEPVNVGELVNEANLGSNLANKKEWTYEKLENTEFTNLNRNMELTGYLRENGEYGIRNELWVVPTVGCINKLVNHYVKGMDVQVLSHPYGCSQSGDDGVNTLKALARIINHPNAGGVVVVGLGCENTQISMVQEAVGKNNRVRYVTLQEVNDEEKVLHQAIKELQAIILKDKRVPMPASKLKIGVECGGSDALSGITANPLLGRLSEQLVVQEGGSVVITEIPEFFGAEQCALNVCSDKSIYQKLNDMFIDYRDFYISNGIEVYENPSPGNKKGGISTLEEKSLGCVNKIGKLPIVDVKDYAQPIDTNGVTVISSPGNDLVATTALGLSGCHIVLFTTGRGTPFGGFVPTIKVSTNSNIYNRKKRWIDFDAGRLLTEDNDAILNEFYDYVTSVCNGTQTNNEKNESHDIAIFKTGVTL